MGKTKNIHEKPTTYNDQVIQTKSQEFKPTKIIEKTSWCKHPSLHSQGILWSSFMDPNLIFPSWGGGHLHHRKVSTFPQFLSEVTQTPPTKIMAFQGHVKPPKNSQP